MFLYRYKNWAHKRIRFLCSLRFLSICIWLWKAFINIHYSKAIPYCLHRLYISFPIILVDEQHICVVIHFHTNIQKFLPKIFVKQIALQKIVPLRLRSNFRGQQILSFSSLCRYFLREALILHIKVFLYHVNT